MSSEVVFRWDQITEGQEVSVFIHGYGPEFVTYSIVAFHSFFNPNHFAAVASFRLGNT